MYAQCSHRVVLGLCGDQMQTLQSSLKKEKNARFVTPGNYTYVYVRTI